MCPGKLKDATRASHPRPVVFTQEAAIWLPTWPLAWPVLSFLTALISLLQLPKFSVTLEDVAAVMVEDLKAGGSYTRMRVGIKK